MSNWCENNLIRGSEKIEKSKDSLLRGAMDRWDKIETQGELIEHLKEIGAM